MWKQTSDSCNSLTTVRPCECEIRIVLFFVLRRAFSRPFVIDLFFASWRAQEARRRYEVYKRPAPSAGLVGLNWRCKGMGNFRARRISEGRGKVGERKRERSPLFHPFLGPLEKVWWKLEKVWWKFCWNLLWEFAERVVGFWREFAEVCQKNRMPPLRLPPWTHKTARQRDIDLQGIIQSGHYVIMSSCRNVIMPLRIFTGKRCIWAQRNSI